MQGFTLESDNLDGQLTEDQVFDGFGYNGKNISPHLRWRNAPTNTKSFAAIVYDPDAPTGSGWWHWIVFNIPVEINELKENAGKMQKKLLPVGCVHMRVKSAVDCFTLKRHISKLLK